MKVDETPVREVEIEGHKAVQYLLTFPNGLGDFQLTPVFPTQGYVDSFFNEYKKKANAEELMSIKSFLGKPARGVEFQALQFLFARDRKMEQGYRISKWKDFDMWDDFVRGQISRVPSILRTSKDKREELGALQSVIDKLQLVFDTPDTQSLPETYKAAMKMIDIEDADTSAELEYIEFLDSAMEQFEELLRRNVGVGFGLYDIRLFNILYRKQELFAGRILAYDLPRIIRNDDVGLDRVLTPLLVLGWGIELAAPFPKTSQEIQDLTVRFLKLYLAALSMRMFYEREVEREKKSDERSYKRGETELTFTELEYDDNEGNHVSAQEMFASLDPNPAEQAEMHSDVETWTRKLTKKQCEIAEMLAQGLKQRDIAERLGVSEVAISKQLKAIRKRLKE